MWATIVIVGKILPLQLFMLPLAFVISGALATEWGWLKRRHVFFRRTFIVLTFLMIDIIFTLLFIAADSKTIVVFN